jgi:membrane protein implicated in regulation of membrane protease activity
MVIGSVLWMSMGVVLILLELALPTNFILLCFGVGCLGGGVVAFLGGPLWLQVGIALSVTASALLVSRRVLHRQESQSREFGTMGLIGQTGWVIETVRGSQGGLVKVEGETWRAVTAPTLEIAPGTAVRVTGVEGNKLVVEPAGPPQ